MRERPIESLASDLADRVLVRLEASAKPVSPERRAQLVDVEIAELLPELRREVTRQVAEGLALGAELELTRRERPLRDPMDPRSRRGAGHPDRRSHHARRTAR